MLAVKTDSVMNQKAHRNRATSAQRAAALARHAQADALIALAFKLVRSSAP